MKYFISIFLVIGACSCSAIKETNYIDDYYQKIYKADIAFMTKNYQKAYDLYQSAFDSCEPINTAMYYEISNFAETCAILGKNDLALQFMSMTIANGATLKNMQQNDNFGCVLDTEAGRALINNYEQLRANYLISLNLELRQEIFEMTLNDQKYRAQPGFTEHKKMKAMQEVIDSYNTKRLKQIFESYGYPSEKLIGGFNVDGTPVSITGILLHTADTIRVNYFIPKLKKFIENGECSPSVLGPVIDQYYLYNGEPQVNGTYTKPDGSYSIMIEDLNEVDKNRTSIGLPPLRLQEQKDRLVKEKYGY